ncbi:uncharacterized protein LOC121986484 [Zingiber officinale]|uniref:uncharacterized protein LOC121986484 n=1 Tax=Zingiber officinale TaxID=94328 RepID=UPI001C4B0586|nr:uncharacterized protein LOC121986484 [Zingiber officinale]
MDPYYQHFGGEMESRYYQPNQPQYYHPEPQYYHPQTQYYQSGPQYYPPIEQPNRYEDTQGQFAEPYPAYQSPQGFQGDYSPTWPHPVHQSDRTPWGTFQDEAPSPNSTQDLKEIIQQMIEYQKQQFAEIQNFQIQVDQFASSISQQQAPCFSEKRDCSVLDRPDLDFITSQDSSNISCYDSVVVRISDFTDTVVVDVTDNAEPQESLPLDTPPEPKPGPEPELLLDYEEVTVTILEPPVSWYCCAVEKLGCEQNLDCYVPKFIDFFNSNARKASDLAKHSQSSTSIVKDSGFLNPENFKLGLVPYHCNGMRSSSWLKMLVINTTSKYAEQKFHKQKLKNSVGMIEISFDLAAGSGVSGTTVDDPEFKLENSASSDSAEMKLMYQQFMFGVNI